MLFPFSLIETQQFGSKTPQTAAVLELNKKVRPWVWVKRKVASSSRPKLATAAAWKIRETYGNSSQAQGAENPPEANYVVRSHLGTRHQGGTS